MTNYFLSANKYGNFIKTEKIQHKHAYIFYMLQNNRKTKMRSKTTKNLDVQKTFYLKNRQKWQTSFSITIMHLCILHQEILQETKVIVHFHNLNLSHRNN